MKRLLAIASAIAIVAGLPVGAAVAMELPHSVAVFDETQITEIGMAKVEDILTNVPNVVSYRFGDDPQGEATLPRDILPAATPDLIGAARVMPGDMGWADLESNLIDKAWMYSYSGDGLKSTADYLWLYSTRTDVAKAAFNATDYTAQIDFVIGVDTLPGWQADPAYPGDTWQGGSLIASAFWAPLSDGANVDPKTSVDFSLVDTAKNFKQVKFDGAFFMGEDWAIAAISLKSLSKWGDNYSFGFSSHVHDGDYGRCKTCESIVTTYPQVPRTAADLYPITASFTMGDKAAPKPTETATPTATTAGDEGKGGGFPWLIVVIPLLIIATLVFFAKRKAPPVPDACKNEKAAWDAARRQRQARQELVDSAQKFMEDRQAFVDSIKARRSEIAAAKRGPRGGIGDSDFARIEGRLIKFEDLTELDNKAAADLASAQADLASAKAELASRTKPLADAKKAEADAKAAFDKCVKDHAAG